MDPLQALKRIKELLQANLLLEDTVRERILYLDPEDRGRIVPVLEALNAKEYEILKRVVVKNPEFFTDLEKEAIAAGQQRFVEQRGKIADLLRTEAAEKEDELAELEAFLNDALN